MTKESFDILDKAMTRLVMKIIAALVLTCLCGMYFTFYENNAVLVVLPLTYAGLIWLSFRSYDRIYERHRNKQR